MMSKDIKHGTYGGYQAEKKLGMATCDDCKRACRDYTRDYRRTRPLKYTQQEKAAKNAHARAAWRLTRLYPEQFRALEEEERAKESALKKGLRDD